MESPEQDAQDLTDRWERSIRLRLHRKNRHFVQCFLDGEQPTLNFRSDREVTEWLTTAYMSAKKERTLEWKPLGTGEHEPLCSPRLSMSRLLASPPPCSLDFASYDPEELAWGNLFFTPL